MARDYKEYEESKEGEAINQEVAIVDSLPTQSVREVMQDGKPIKLLTTNEAVQLLWNKVMVESAKKE